MKRETKTGSRIGELRQLRSAIREAEANLHKAVAAAFKPGTIVYWSHGSHRRGATVVRVADDRLFVQSETADGYWVEANRVTGALRMEGTEDG